MEEDRTEVARQLHTVTGREYGPEEVEEMVYNGGAEQIYRQALSSVNGAAVGPPTFLAFDLISCHWCERM